VHVEEIRARIRKHPFVPFRLYVSDGSRYDVLHHDFAIVTSRYVTVAVGAPSPDDLPDRLVDIDPLHITRIEPLADGRRTHRKRKRR
jgi:hypothetical protein